MARPTTKAELLNTSNQQFKKLWTIIDELSPSEQEASFDFDQLFLDKKKEAHWKRDQNLRDVLIHLYEWHYLVLNWVALNQEGKATPFIPAPYNWRTYGELNKEFIAKHQQTSLSQAKELVRTSHEKISQLMTSFSTEELFTKGAFSWTGTSSLGNYFVSATSSHYEWAVKKIKTYKKSIVK